MASATWKSRHEVQRTYDAMLASMDDEFDLDDVAGEQRGSDPHYIDLPCYVPLLDDNGLDPFALDISSVERH